MVHYPFVNWKDLVTLASPNQFVQIDEVVFLTLIILGRKPNKKSYEL
jgi:hypothetical protein